MSAFRDTRGSNFRDTYADILGRVVHIVNNLIEYFSGDFSVMTAKRANDYMKHLVLFWNPRLQVGANNLAQQHAIYVTWLHRWNRHLSNLTGVLSCVYSGSELVLPGENETFVLPNASLLLEKWLFGDSMVDSLYGMWLICIYYPTQVAYADSVEILRMELLRA
jgi:hypothetical protein